MIQAPETHDASAVARHYDELDRFYRELWGEDLHHGLWCRGGEDVAEATENLTRLVADRARIRAGTDVCDVGCGYGGPARFFANDRGARVIGLTLSQVQHHHAERRTADGERVHVLHRDWLENDLPAASFDAVVALESASHMPDKPRFLSECRRVLRPGGRLVLATWLAGPAPSRWEIRHLLEPICAEGRLAGLATRAEYEGWLKEAGLRLTAFDELSRRVRGTWTVCLRRVVVGALGDPEARRYLLDREKSERVFARAVARIWLAYRTGALGYGVFTATPT